MKKRIGYLLGLWTVICLISPTAIVYGAGWELDGNRWQYTHWTGDPGEDEWIADNGKEYYVDSKGYLKTGWVTDASDGKKYYTGEDGAKRYNMFTPDGKYVGPEGTVIERFDTYRKEAKKQLNSLLKSKEFREREAEGLPGFLMVDLNDDEYRDIVAVNYLEQPDRVVMVALWDPEEEVMQLAAEAEFDGADVSAISYNEQTGSMWHVVTEPGGHKIDYFELQSGSNNFEHVWYFQVDSDEWGIPVYYINGDDVSAEEWHQAVTEAAAESGTVIESGYQILDETHMVQAIDQAPTEGELQLWDEDE